ncbi:hypothetical protein [Kineococcus sp. SYSU DK003]|uniref:hypothetical protein n=1 Tax=Kineococcus sp. SYSU DK003 TaxID=3383124 RepID=UPI003D7EF24C
MSGPVAAALPLSVFLLAALVVAVVVIARRVPSHELTAPVARARRRGTVLGALALAVAAALTVVGTSLPQTSLPRTQLVAVAPLVAAAVHAAVLLVGELSWPRPAQRVRSARLAVRSVRHQAAPGAGVLFLVAGALTLATCAAGTLLADDSGRAVSWSDGTASSSAGPFPGAYYAGPVALAAVVAVALTSAVLLRVPHRPAVPGADAATDGALRRAAAHRALRGCTAGLLGTTAAMLVLGGTAAGRLDGEASPAPGSSRSFGPGPLWNAVADGVTIAGAVLLLAALAVLLVPARGPARA